MRGGCVIDGVDIADFGMFILRGGDNDFISYPERKMPYSNDWYEYNGIDADLTDVYFKEKTVSVKFHISASTGTEYIANWAHFRSLITAPGYRSVYIREFQKTFLLRYISCSDFNHKGGLVKSGKKSGDLTIEFSMDDPLQFFVSPEILDPVVEFNNATHVSIGGRDLADYGIIVTECYSSILAAAPAKEPLTRSFEHESGLLVYPPSVSNFDTKQITIACAMRAGSIGNFWHNYEALFNALTVKEELSVSTYAGSEKCFYSSMKNFNKRRPFRERVRVSFDLVLTVLETGDVAFVLASEDGRLIMTEDSNNYIDMAYYG
ncbi:hypothetical protein LJC38_00075 [Parabacteroides sp. OttesenSCG-928-K15]|nr:hypothetical protein [Parabacteroides sp. OttesenSCG-928-K15]